jgi:integrase
MTDQYPQSVPMPQPPTPWNKGKLMGSTPPRRPRHVWAIRTKLQLENRSRDHALFNLAIDSKLRGCDLVALKVDDVAPRGYAISRAYVRQSKTGRPVKFEITDHTRESIDIYRGCSLDAVTQVSICRPGSTQGCSASG